MKFEVLKNMEGSVRSLCGEAANEVSTGQIKLWLKEAAQEIAIEIDGIFESWTTDTVAEQEAYVLPDDVLKIEQVTYDGYRLRYIDRRTWSTKSNDGQDITSATPAYYMIEENELKLYPIPDTGSKAIIVRYRRRPTLSIREYKGAGTGGSTTTVADTGFPGDWGCINNRANEDTPYFNHCQMRITLNADSAGDAPQGEYSYVTGYNESTGTFTVSPAFSAAVAVSDVYELQDIVEIPMGFAYTATFYAAARVLLASPNPADGQKASLYEQKWMKAMSDIRARFESPVRNPDDMGRIYPT